MKKILSVILVLTILLSSVGVFAETTEAPEKMYIFVKSGATGGDGSKDNPFGTFEEARDKIREIKAKDEYPEGGVVVYFREGVYTIDKIIWLKNEQDSGTKEGPIVYRSYMDEEVKFVGGLEIDVSKFSPVTDEEVLKRISVDAKDKILVANLKDFGVTDYGKLNVYGGGSGYFTSAGVRLDEHGITVPKEQPPEIFFGDTQGKLARYPNDDFTRTGKIIQTGDEIQMWQDSTSHLPTYVPYEEREYPPKPSIYEVSQDVRERMQNWKNEDEIWVYGYFGENWSDTSLPVREIDIEGGVITTELPSPKPIKSNMRYYIYNVFAELDAPGEYYLDRETGNLYIYPINSKDKVTFTSLNNAFLFITDVDYVSLKGLSFVGSRKTAIHIYGCTNINIEHCSISKVAGKAIEAQNLLDCSIKSCHIYQAGTGGIYIGIRETDARGEIAKDARQNLPQQNNIIENCEIEDVGRISATYSPMISLGGSGNFIRHCSIHGGDHMALSPDANDLIVEYNEFYDLLRTSDDSGAIYDGWTKTRRGQIIRHNYFHDIQSSSTSGTAISMVYADDTKDETTVESNIFHNIGGRNMIFYANGGRDHTIKNNIVINADTFVHFNNHPIGSSNYVISKYDFLDYLDNPAYAKYPHFAEFSEKQEDFLPAKYNTVKNNVLIGVNTENTSKNLVAEENDINPSIMLEKGSDPGFVNLKKGNLTLREDSEIYEVFPDFVAPDFEKMGMYTSTLKILLGEETLSFLEGSPKVYEGFESSEINPRHDAAPEIKAGVAYLPIRYISQYKGATIEYNDETAEIEIGYGFGSVVLKPGDYYTVNGTALVPAEKVTAVFGDEIKVFDNGVIIMGNDNRVGENFPELTEELARRLSNE